VTTSRVAATASALTLALLTSACGGTRPVGEHTPDRGDFTASIEGAQTSGAKTVVVWVVFASSPDYGFVFGGGASQGSSVHVTFGGPPPAEALNGGKLGIGIVAVLADGVTLPEGKVGDLNLSVLFQAVSADHAVIYRATTETLIENDWDATFPQGYACGKCVRTGATFDTYAVEDCSKVKIVPLSSNPDLCNVS
jgi:hypothetical protein